MEKNVSTQFPGLWLCLCVYWKCMCVHACLCVCVCECVCVWFVCARVHVCACVCSSMPICCSGSNDNGHAGSVVQQLLWSSESCATALWSGVFMSFWHIWSKNFPSLVSPSFCCLLPTGQYMCVKSTYLRIQHGQNSSFFDLLAVTYVDTVLKEYATFKSFSV